MLTVAIPTAAQEETSGPTEGDVAPPGDGEPAEGIVSLEVNERPSNLPPELAVEAGEDETTLEKAPVTVETIVNQRVVSASKSMEDARSAPAWIISITRKDIRERGYTELSQLLKDLPAVDNANPYGAVYTRNYFRGYRNYPGEAYLLMIDGVVFNQLWINDAQIMSTFPLTNIKRVEVVYGPSSAVYGPNAAMGVINVITCKPTADQKDLDPSDSKSCDDKAPGASSYSRLSAGMPTGAFQFVNFTKTGDVNVLYKQPLSEELNLVLSATARVSQGVLDPSVENDFYFTRERFLKDPNLWGEWANDHPNISGRFRSPIDQQGIDVRGYLGSVEIAGQYFRMSTGQGTLLPTDRSQVLNPWTSAEKSFYVRHTHQFSKEFNVVTLARYRESDILDPSTFIYRSVTAQDDAALTYWSARNSSYWIGQDYGWQVESEALPGDLYVGFGFAYEHRDLERAYVVASAPIDTTNPVSSTWPLNSDNREEQELFGSYALGRFEIAQDNFLHAGLRLDYNSTLDTLEPSLRGGYVGIFRPFTAKLLYGQAFQEPTARQTFGSFSDASDRTPDLRPERSQTLEASLEFAQSLLWLRLGGYYITYSNPIITDAATSDNLESREIVGLDVGATALLPLGRRNTLKLWTYYSPMLLLQETSLQDETQTVRIGDIAAHKVRSGITASLVDTLDLTFLGRWNSRRPTVETNPTGIVPAHFELDANIRYRAAKGVGLSVRGTNLIGRSFHHPGVASADGGDADERVSQGDFNSRLPQPGRSVHLILDLDLETASSN